MLPWQQSIKQSILGLFFPFYIQCLYVLHSNAMYLENVINIHVISIIYVRYKQKKCMQDCGISLPTGKKKFSSINAGIQKGDHSSTYYVIMFLTFLGPPTHLLNGPLQQDSSEALSCTN